jgi:hypothetical protein
MTNSDEHLDYFHKEKDSKVNAETKPPNDEEIRIPTIWVFEVFPPEYIENLYNSIEKLELSASRNNLFGDSQNTIHNMRHRVAGGGWINLGYYLNNKSTNSSIVDKLELPNEVKSIRASIFQPIPSTTILICQFFLEDTVSNILDKTLRDSYTTYKEKIKNGYTYITVELQKENTINLNLEYLNSICTTWLKKNFLGLYSSNEIDEKHPVSYLITLEKETPFNNNSRNIDYMSILNLKRKYNVWKSEDLDGIYLQLKDDRNEIRKRLVLSCNINDVLNNKDISTYGETQESRVVNYLQYLDHTFGTWILDVLLDSYIYKITDLRDAYGKTVIDETKDTINDIRKLDYKVLQIEKNILPFNLEIKNYVEDEKYFLHDIYEFNLIDEKFKDEKLFSNIRQIIIDKTILLSENEQILRDTAKALRELNTVVSNDKLAKTNIKMQKSMLFLTWVILFFTVVSAVSTVVGSWDNMY